MADDPYDLEPEEEEPPRSIFSAMWFRALVVVLVVGVIAAVAVPYALDLVSPPTVATLTEPPRPVPMAPLPPKPTPPSAVTAIPAPPPAPSPPPPAASTPEPPKPPPAVEAPAPARPAAPAPKPSAPKPVTTAKAMTPTATGPYWVQVGAFRDTEAAKRLAARLREQNYGVEESEVRVKTGGATTAQGAAQSDQYDVFVAGAPADELQAKLAAKGLAGEPSGEGVVVKPSLSLRDAVQLSKDLAGAGLKVHVRRADGAERPRATPALGEVTFHRVRVGGYANRAAALAAARELEAKGFKPFVVRSSQ